MRFENIPFPGGRPLSVGFRIIYMQFLSLSRRRVDQFPPEAFTAELVALEASRVKALYASGVLRQVWKRADTPGAAILWEAASETEVRAAIASLPILQAGMLEIVAVVPLEPYPGFAV
jgi:muconolactone delta-isomerase